MGLFKTIGCDVKTADAGRSCTDFNECQGICVAPGGKETGDSATGTCSAYMANFGNVSQVINGKVENSNVE
jgi:hypothetical protein